jgi:hypothetical protein
MQCFNVCEQVHDLCAEPQITPLRRRAMAQAVSCPLVASEALVRARVSQSVWDLCGQSGTGTGFSPSSSVFRRSPNSYHLGMCNMLTSEGIHAWVLDPPHLQEKKTA